MWALVFVVLVLPISVSAGLVDVISNLFYKDIGGENLPVAKNIQHMSLLAATISPTQNNKTSFETTPQGDALVSDAGPLGSSADVSTQKPSSDQISVYVVHQGDTLSQIAEMFDVTVNTIKWGNDLSSNTLKEGQTLIILPISGVKYVVVKGDTLDSVAKKFKGDKDEILAYNNLESGAKLAVGSTIIIPDGEAISSPSSSGGSSIKPSSGLKEYVGYYLKPVAGAKKTQGIHGHNGIDFGAPVGTPILASASGEVIISRASGWNGGYGSYVVIRHSNGTQTLYAHMSRNVSSVGESVKQGDIIGYVGISGKATGPHLHFEIRGAKNPF